MDQKDYDLKTLIGNIYLRTLLSSSPSCLIPLFHGTDRAIYEMGQEKRAELREACLTVIDCLLPVYVSHDFRGMTSQEQDAVLGGLRVRILDAYSKATYRRDNSPLYQHDNVYLSFDPNDATVYAQYAWVCGELGYIAYWLWRGTELLGYTLPSMTDKQAKALQMVRDAGARTPDPVTLMFCDIPKENLKTDRGDDIDWDRQIDWFLRNVHVGRLRVLGDFDISKGTIVDLEQFPVVSKE